MVRTAKMLLLGMIFISLGTTASLAAPSPPQVDLPILRDVICAFETQNLPDDGSKDEAVEHGNGVGRCQIQPRTAKRAGCDWWRLRGAEYSRACALKILTDICKGSVYRRAYCYNPSRAYAKTITAMYAAAMRERDWKLRRG